MFVALFIVVAVLTQVVSGVLFSPYKDVTINMDWNTNVLTTQVTGSRQSVLNVLPQSGADTLTWAFATGNCGSENWGGINATALADANVKSWASAGKKYIIATGGASGAFRCTSDSDFNTFINRYNSNSLVGIDFDIEGGVSQSDIDSLVQRVKNAQGNFPKLRFSFTLACFGGNANPILGTYGVMTMNSIKNSGLNNYYINLMTMDYGSAIASNCVVGSDGHCDMGKSAVNAAKSFHSQYGVSYDHIEITPMIGGNDDVTETFNSSDDVDEVVSFAVQNGLGGVHHWSFDRDNDCSPGYASPTCNTYAQAGTLGYTKKFSSSFNGPVTPVVSPVASPTKSPTSGTKVPTTPKPSTKVPTTPKPSTKVPTTPKPSTKVPTTPKPTTKVPTTPKPTTKVPTTPKPTTKGPTPSTCAATGCHGCLWTYSTGTTCFPDYPKEACEAYAGQGYQWCP